MHLLITATAYRRTGRADVWGWLYTDRDGHAPHVAAIQTADGVPAPMARHYQKVAAEDLATFARALMPAGATLSVQIEDPEEIGMAANA